MHILWIAFAGWLIAAPASADYRDERQTVLDVYRDYPGLITKATPCGVFVDQVAHRLNRKDGVLRWGRKAREADGDNPNCDALTYLNDGVNRAHKTIIDIISLSAKNGIDSPNARPAWQEFLGDNPGNGYWTEPETPDRDVVVPVPDPPAPPPPPPIPVVDLLKAITDVRIDLIRVETKIDTITESLEAHRAASRSLRDRVLGFLRDPRTIATALGILAGRLAVP